MRQLSHLQCEKFRRLDGAEVIGFLSEPNLSQLSTGVTAPPRRLFHVYRSRFLQSSDEIRSPTGEIYILGEYPAALPGYVSYRAFQATDTAVWQRRTKVINPVTGVEVDAGLQAMGLINLSLEVMDDDNLRGFTSKQSRFITGEDVQIGDLVKNKRVKDVTKIFGINIVEIE